MNLEFSSNFSSASKTIFKVYPFYVFFPSFFSFFLYFKDGFVK